MYMKILLTVDLNDESSWKKALPQAMELCRASGGVLHVVTVIPDFGLGAVGSFFPADYEEKSLKKANEDLKAFISKHVPSEVESRHLIGYGTVYKEILRVAEDIKCDLIVVAAHRPDLKDYLLGPNAARVVRHADCSVMVVRD